MQRSSPKNQTLGDPVPITPDIIPIAKPATPIAADIIPISAATSTTPPIAVASPIQNPASPSPEEHQLSLKELVSEGNPDDKYQTKRKVGEGAGGEIYLAMEIGSSRDVAIKKMALTPQNIKMIANEVHIMKTSKHPNIVEFFECYIVEERLWVIMEYSEYLHLSNVC